MTTMNRWLATAVAVAAMSLGASNLMAQNNNQNNGNNGGRQRRGFGNFDPAQFQQQMMDGIKDRLEITDDAEWKALQPMVQKVVDLRRETMPNMRGLFRPRGGDNNSGDQNRPRGGGMFGGTPSPDAEALQKAIDSKASNSEMKAAVAKYQEARKAKLADLEKAQADLRKVLTVRQEAIATSIGLL